MLAALLRLLGLRREAPSTEPPGPPPAQAVPVHAVGEAAPLVSADLLRRPALPATTAREEADTVQRRLLRDAIDPALAVLAELGIRCDDRARVMLLAIAGQEADWQHRRQHNGGPALGLWQFERGGGVLGVLTHPATVQAAARLCQARGVQPVVGLAWEALERDDVLAAGMARLLLYSDPKPLPVAEAEGWALYLRTWRPGKPHPERWSACWRAAEAAAFRGG